MREALGVAVHSAGCTCPEISSCSGTWDGSMSGLMSGLMLPRRVSSSSGVGEVLCSPSIGLRSEASTISSPLNTNRGAMHCCSFCATSQRTPVGNPDSSAWACSTLAKVGVFCCLIIWKLEEVEEGM